MQSGKREVVRKYFWFFIGYFLTYGAYYAILLLQSSINIEHGLGATSASVTYACSVIFSILLAPVILRSLGEKYAAILSQATYLIYILANFYPEPYILIPAGAIVAIGEAAMWPSLLLFSVHYARCYARYGTKDVTIYETLFLGLYFSGFYLSEIFANLVSYGILFGGKQIQLTVENQTEKEVDFSHCGKNDCQDPNATQQNIEMYVPTSQVTRNLVLGVMAGMILVAIIVYLTLVEEIDPSLECVQLENLTREETVISKTDARQTSSNRPDEEEINLDKILHKNKKPPSVLSSVKATFRLFLNPLQLLLAPFALYSGLYVAFVFAELTRAYGSCLIGVHQIGLFIAINCAASGLWSMFVSMLSSRLGRKVPMVIGFGIDMSLSLFLLFWQPSIQNLCWIYGIFVTSGFATVTWITLIGDTYSEYFSYNRDIAFVAWNAWFMIGVSWQFGWSTSICVETKIYVQMGFLCFSTLCYGVAYYVYKKTDKEELQKFRMQPKIIE